MRESVLLWDVPIETNVVGSGINLDRYTGDNPAATGDLFSASASNPDH